MARARSHSRAGFTTGRRRAPSTWARDVSPVAIVVPAASKVLLLTVALNNPGIGETVRRTRGTFYITSDQSMVIEEQYGAFGMVVVSDLALAAGAASIPGPSTNASDDGWFLWEPFLVQQTLASAQAAANGVGRIDFDSKAMRRVEEGFGIAIMVENAHATDGLEIACGFSLLTSLS